MRRFCPAAKRRREIVKHALYVGAADTEDFDRWLISWAQHNPRSKDPIGALMMAAERMGRPISEAYAETILDEAKRGRRYHKADSVGRLLGVTYAVRQRLRLTTIGCIDVSKRGRKHLRKVRDKIKKRNSRRAAGVRSQPNTWPLRWLRYFSTITRSNCTLNRSYGCTAIRRNGCARLDTIIQCLLSRAKRRGPQVSKW